MFEGDPTATTPMNPIAPPPPPARKSGGVPAGRLVALGLLAFALAAFTGRVDFGSLVSTARTYVDRPAAPAVQTNTSSTDTAAVAAVKDVVQRANEAQIQAFTRNDPTFMRATATTSYYQELVQTNQSLQSSGAQSIALTKLEWVDVTVSGGTFTAVTATWTVPAVSTTSSGADATWVGIGGLTSNDLLQAGTQAMVDGSGTVEYSSWIEMLPQSSRNVPLTVSAGDSVTVTITQQSGNDWLISIKNNTTKGSYSVTVQYSSSNSSAEWVQEAPSVGRGLISLDQFGTVQFSGASAIRDGKTMSLSALGAKAITMINGQGQAIAQPSTVSSDGSSFTVARTEATSTPQTGGRRRRP